MKDDETLDDLQINQVRIFQKKDGFRFGMDAVLLANFARVKKHSTIVDLCSGTGIISFIIAQKQEFKNMIGLEIQDDLVEMANRSSEFNNLSKKVNFFCVDIRDVDNIKRFQGVDIVTANPPYKINNSGILNENEKDRISRHEILCTLEDVILASFILLKDNGRLFIINRAERIADVICVMRKHKIEPKTIQLVQSKKDKAPHLVMVEGQKYGGAFININPTLMIYDDNGNYSEEIRKIYNITSN